MLRQASRKKAETMVKDTFNNSAQFQKVKTSLTSGADNLLASGQIILDAKKIEAEKFLLEKQEELKRRAEQEVKNQANKQIENFFK
jgi:hypothetical protein